MISLDTMLFFIFTKKRLLAGVQNSDNSIKTIDIHGQWFYNYEGKSIPEVLENVWPAVLETYNHTHGSENTAPIAISVPYNFEDSKRNEIHQVLGRLGGERFHLYFEDKLASSFVHGMLSRKKLEGNNSIILEALDDYLNLWKVHIDPRDKDQKYIGREAFEASEKVETKLIKEIGPSTGRSRLMSELIKKFQAAGLSLNLDSQTELAHQLMSPTEDLSFVIKHETEDISLEGSARFSPENYEDLYAVNREKLQEFLSKDVLEQGNVSRVFTMGQFFQNGAMKNYFMHELGLGEKLTEMDEYGVQNEFDLIFSGLAKRTSLILDAETHKSELEAQEAKKREEEEQKRKMVKAELEAKDARESLFEEIRNTCINPSLQEEYEQKFIPRGEQLGIPDLVIKWNISEILSKISLTEEAQTIGIIEKGDEKTEEVPSTEEVEVVQEDILEKEEDEVVLAAPVAAPVMEAELEAEPQEVVNGHHSEEKEEDAGEKVLEEVVLETTSTNENGQAPAEAGNEEQIEEENKDFHVESEETESEIKDEEPVFVLSPAERQDNSQPAPVKISQATPVITVKTEEAKPNGTLTKEKNEKQRFGLGDIFSLKSDLKDPEFISKVVSFKSDSVLQTLRLLKEEERGETAREEAFKKLHQKEKAFYGDASEISEAKEGLYYYRPFIERNSLKNYLITNGFTKKERVESLSSSELKFILMVFKEVRALSQPHANLSEETIIVVEKRKLLQKNQEITFVGFTSEDVSNNDMVEATHKAFSKVMGESFYYDFRKKFQL